jgi:fibronectin type 3 domain-containing protein
VRDVFPPETPKGLVAVPGMAGDAATIAPTIELSWDPDVEPRLAGYRVYRGEEGSPGWVRVGPALVTEAAYRDLKVTPGRKYSYRVTAVSTAGKESAPSAEVTETAAQ